MNDNFDDIFDNDETSSLINKYETMLDENKEYFFDISEFEDIIDHYISERQSDAALQVIDFADKQHPSEINFSIKKAYIYIEKEMSDKALETLHSIESLANKDVDFYYILGEAFLSINEIEKASLVFNKLIKLFAVDDYAGYAIDIFQIYDKYNKQLHAIKFLKNAFIYEPENITLLHFIAYSYEQIGQYQEAINCYKSFLENHPFSDTAWFNLGIIFYNRDNFDSAIEAFEYAIAINPDNVIEYFHLANSYFANELYEKAIVYYNEFLKEENDDPIAEFYLGQSFYFINEKDEALKHYENCIKIDEYYPQAYFEIAKIYSETNDNVEAFKYLDKAIELDPENDEYYNLKGTIYFNRGNTDFAIAEFKKAIEINSLDDEYILNLSDTYSQTENYTEAIKILEEKKEVFNNSIIYFRLSAYYLLNKNKTKAIVFFEKGLMLNYSNYTELLYLYPKALDNKEFTKLLEKYK